MRRLKRVGLAVIMLTFATALVACGKKDELVLVTTENTTEITTEATTEVTTEDTTEEVTEKEKRITYQDMYAANKGDVLLSGGENYSINTIYYANGEETFSEYQFLGFDSVGMYAQVYEDSDGYVKVLDAANNYWYQFKDNQLSILLYPEPLVAAAIIDSNHNSMIFGLAGDSEAEVVKEVYKQDGMLMVETLYEGPDGDSYAMVYTLDDKWIVQQFDCNSLDGEKLSYSSVTAGASYDIPELITQAMAMEQGYRTINITYVDGDQYDMPYYTPVDVPVEISTLEYDAYSDEACTIQWSEVDPDENGVYKDVTIYMKKSTKEGE